jgi:hypothetical protein
MIDSKTFESLADAAKEAQRLADIAEAEFRDAQQRLGAASSKLKSAKNALLTYVETEAGVKRLWL